MLLCKRAAPSVMLYLVEFTLELWMEICLPYSYTFWRKDVGISKW